jgi:glycosidase
MHNSGNRNEQAALTLARILPRLETSFEVFIRKDPASYQSFIKRLQNHFPTLFDLLIDLYGNQYDFFFHIEALLKAALNSWIERPDQLKQLDEHRENHPEWYLSNQMVGGVCYVDLFANNLKGIQEKIPYFKELGLTYLHLMPLYEVPEGDNDGGYAVSSYREIHPPLGTIDELRALAEELRKNGINLVLDLVFNHTSDEHVWAEQAKADDPFYQRYYHIYPDRQIPNAYDAHLREIFPEKRPGSFTFFPEINKWVWTTFNSYQWDLNYNNPMVFTDMCREMLFLANAGVDVLRLDAVAFIWKKMGTGCENLPEAHQLIRAFNTVARIAAPSLLFKSEAIVHPDDVMKYIDQKECQLSYNPLLMALLWNSLATREVRLLKMALVERHQLPEYCTWVNYVRCHDDIGWTFSDEDAWRLGVNGFDHRQFLNAFYTGRFNGSFARGLPFQENPKTGDARISGTCASLTGLEKGIVEHDKNEIDLAIKRILLLYAVTLTVGGIPLIYLGDEIGIINDYGYRDNADKAQDSRWVHRPAADWNKYALRNEPHTIQYRIFSNLQKLIQLRKSHPAIGNGRLEIIQTGNDHILGYVRTNDKERIVIFANFTEDEQHIDKNLLRVYGLSYQFEDLVSLKEVVLEDRLLQPYQFLCLKADHSND